MTERLLPLSEVQRRVPKHRATIYRWIKAGKFPRSIELSPGCVMWKASEIEAWIAARPSRSAGSKEAPTLEADQPSPNQPIPA